MPGEIILITFMVVVGTVVLAVFCAGWFVVAVTRGTFRVLTGHRSHRPPRPSFAAARGQCPRDGCAAANPAHARFCRRCGQPLFGVPRSAGGRRAAVW